MDDHTKRYLDKLASYCAANQLLIIGIARVLVEDNDINPIRCAEVFRDAAETVYKLEDPNDDPDRADRDNLLRWAEVFEGRV